MLTATELEIPALPPNHAVRNFSVAIVAMGVLAALIGWLGVFSVHVSTAVSRATWDGTARTITGTVELHNKSRLAIDVVGAGSTGTPLIQSTSPRRVHIPGGATRAVTVQLQLAGCDAIRAHSLGDWHATVRVRTPGGAVHTVLISAPRRAIDPFGSVWQFFEPEELCAG